VARMHNDVAAPAALDSGSQETENGGTGEGGSTCSLRWTTAPTGAQNGSSRLRLQTGA
jgi:hypothetical protein